MPTKLYLILVVEKFCVKSPPFLISEIFITGTALIC